MAIKLGLEVEFFATRKGLLINPKTLGCDTDEYPLLVEARGQPFFNDPFSAVASVRGEIEKQKFRLEQAKAKPLFVNWAAKDEHYKKLHQEILRAGLHKSISWQNMHGKSVSAKNETHLSAGLHISFTNERSTNYTTTEKCGCTNTHEIKYNVNFDYLKIFLALEKEFRAEIEASERGFGFYEVKDDGRIEYRSLPATIIHDKKFAQRLSNCLK